MIGDVLSEEVERIAAQIVDAIFNIHVAMGPGLLESLNVKVLLYELRKRGLKVAHEVPLPVVYDGVVFEEGYRIDLLVEDRIVIEVKSVEKLHPIHAAQLSTYLKLSGKRLGFLVNFNVKLIKDGIKRMVL